MTPLRVRGYTVERLLGAGASSDVWQARVVASGACVALKRIAIRDDAQLRRAEAEAALLAALEHPNLVRLHATHLLDDAMVLVLDLAEAGSLADVLASRGRITPGETVAAMAPVAAALAYLHDEGVVHGDVSAANVLFTASGEPLLGDVGVARLTGDERDAEASPGYVDPAVAAGCIPGPPSDVFMAAAVALHAVTGAPPWPDAEPGAALARAARGVVDGLPERLGAAAVPPRMADVLLRALSPEPERRGTAADLALDLAHSAPAVSVELAAGRSGVAQQPVGAPGLARQPVRASGPRHAAWIAAADRRPDFERPREVSNDRGGPPPTRLVAPRPRPVIPRRAPRRRIGWRVVGAVAAAVVGCLAVVAFAAARSPGRPPAAQPVPGRPSAAQPVPRRPSAAQPVPHTPTVRVQVETTAPAGGQAGPVPGAAFWQAQLERLDALRARAFATHDPALLRQVYAAGPLLEADRAYLRRLPQGCALTGVRTDYSAVRVHAGLRTAVVTATARLSASRLVCAGRPARAVPGAGPSRLRIRFVRTAAGVRIASLVSAGAAR